MASPQELDIQIDAALEYLARGRQPRLTELESERLGIRYLALEARVAALTQALEQIASREYVTGAWLVARMALDATELPVDSWDECGSCSCRVECEGRQ